MSGLFMRLAAYANGQRGATLHTPASLPYYSGPESVGIDISPPALGPAIGLEPSPAAVEAPLHPDSSCAAGVLPIQIESKDVRADKAEHPFAGATMLSAGGYQIANPAPLPPSRPVDTETAHALAVPPVLLRTSVGTTEPGRPQQSSSSADHQLEIAQQTLPPPPGSARRSALSASAASSDMADALVVPPTLLSPRHQSGRQQAGPSAPTPTSTQPRQPDEVHIHIGRIEISAIQEAPPSKREARKGAAPLSLDDYLARRKGDGS